MRNSWFDRSMTERRLGVRQAAIAAWAVVFVLFALVFVVPGIAGSPTAPVATPDHAISNLVAHAQLASDSCHCGDDYDHMAEAPSPSMC